MSKERQPARAPRPVETEAGMIEFVPAYAYIAPAEEVWQDLRDLHHRSLGEDGPFESPVANELTPDGAFSAFSNITIAVNAQLALTGVEGRTALLHSLGEFAKKHGSLDGLESPFLNAGWAAREDRGALDYTAQVLGKVGLPDQPGGGAETTFLFDADGHRLHFVERDQLTSVFGGGGKPADHWGGKVPVTAAELSALYEPEAGLAPGSDPTGFGSGPAGLGDATSDWTPDTGIGEGGGLEHDGGSADKKKGGGTSKGGEDGGKTKGGVKEELGKIGKDAARGAIEGAVAGAVKGATGGTAAGALAGARAGASGLHSVVRPIDGAAAGLAGWRGAVKSAFMGAISGAGAAAIKGIVTRWQEGGGGSEGAEPTMDQTISRFAIFPGEETGCPLDPEQAGWPYPYAETFVPTGPGLEIVADVDGWMTVEGLPAFDSAGEVLDPGFLTETFFEDLTAIPADPDTPVTPGLEPIADQLVETVLDQLVVAEPGDSVPNLAPHVEVLEELKHEHPHF